jgi:hypothetical protein
LAGIRSRLSAASNNGMHPTPHHGPSHVRCAGARVMPGVRWPNLEAVVDV